MASESVGAVSHDGATVGPGRAGRRGDGVGELGDGAGQVVDPGRGPDQRLQAAAQPVDLAGEPGEGLHPRELVAVAPPPGCWGGRRVTGPTPARRRRRPVVSLRSSSGTRWRGGRRRASGPAARVAARPRCRSALVSRSAISARRSSRRWRSRSRSSGWVVSCALAGSHVPAAQAPVEGHQRPWVSVNGPRSSPRRVAAPTSSAWSALGSSSCEVVEGVLLAGSGASSVEGVQRRYSAHACGSWSWARSESTARSRAASRASSTSVARAGCRWPSPRRGCGVLARATRCAPRLRSSEAGSRQSGVAVLRGRVERRASRQGGCRGRPRAARRCPAGPLRRHRVSCAACVIVGSTSSSTAVICGPARRATGRGDRVDVDHQRPRVLRARGSGPGGRASAGRVDQPVPPGSRARRLGAGAGR